MRTVTPTVVPTEQEIADMFSAYEDSPRDRMLLKLMYFFGLKTRELLALTPGDFDFEFNVLDVRRGKRTRHLPIPKGFLDEITAYLEGRPRSSPLFPLTDRHIRRLVKSAALKAGVSQAEKITPHSLREAYATNLRRSGMDRRDMQRLLGHARTETTDLYVRKDSLKGWEPDQ